MSLTIGTASGNKTAGAMTLGTASGNKTILAGYVGTSGGNKLFFTATPTVTATPSAQSDGDSTATHTFASETASIIDGLGPFTYAWTYSSSLNGTFSFSGGISNTATVAPEVSGVPGATLAEAVLICTVTDTATGVTAESNSVSLLYARS